ncbi:MAG: GSU2204 family CXXCH-containing (seleno)protein [Thermoanaerobaculum sp.]
MRPNVRLTLLLFASIVPAVVWAQLTGSVQLGGHGAQEKDNPARASEYATTQSGPDSAVSLQYTGQGFYLGLDSLALSSERQDHALTIELGRLVRSHTTFSKLPHRLVHDSLANLAGAIADVKIVYATDMDPRARYGIRYDQFANHTDIQIPGASWLTISTDFREQWRQGHVQALSTSHCYSCHIVSQSRALDHHTKDAGLSATVTLGNWSVKASASTRDAREREGAPLRLYERAQHPALRTPLFDDRVTYDERNGPLPFNWYPTQEKDTYKLTVANVNFGGFSFLLSGTTSELTNTHTGNKVDYDGVSLTLARKLSPKARLAVYLRTYSFESTDYFYDSPEPAAVAGPYAGKTYRQRYGFDPDYLRQSALDRDVTEGIVRLTYRLGKLTTLTGQYQARQVDRANYQVAPDETTTLEQKVKLNLATRPVTGLHLQAFLTYADISHPFMALNAACNPDPLQTTPAPSPLAPGSVQYYQIHDARVADLTASPSRFWEARASASYQLGGASMANLSVSFWDGDNDDLDLTNWSKTVQAVTASVTWQPSEAIQTHAGASYGKRETETFVCIPLMDG